MKEEKRQHFFKGFCSKFISVRIMFNFIFIWKMKQNLKLYNKSAWEKTKINSSTMLRTNSKLDGSFVYVDLYYTSKPPEKTKKFDISLQDSCKETVEDSVRLFQVAPSIDPKNPSQFSNNQLEFW